MSAKKRVNPRKNEIVPQSAGKTPVSAPVSPSAVKFPVTVWGKALIILSILLLAAGFASLRYADAVAGNIHSFLSVIMIIFGYLAFILAFLV